MVCGVYLASGNSLFTLVAIPAPPSTSSRADASQNRFQALVRMVCTSSTTAYSSTMMAR